MSRVTQGKSQWSDPLLDKEEIREQAADKIGLEWGGGLGGGAR